MTAPSLASAPRTVEPAEEASTVLSSGNHSPETRFPQDRQHECVRGAAAVRSSLGDTDSIAQGSLLGVRHLPSERMQGNARSPLDEAFSVRSAAVSWHDVCVTWLTINAKET